MSVELIVQPKQAPMTGEAFRAMTGPFSIALDGFVAEGPWFLELPGGPSQCFNHHEGVPRLETRATCAQVLMAIRQGLFQTFRDRDGPCANVYVNDCDEDVCMSWFLLKYNVLSAQILNPNLNRLVHMVDMMDTTCGAYPFPEDLPSLRSLAWVFEPYRRLRFTDGLSRRDPDAFRSVIGDVERRIMAYITGSGEEINLDTRYDVLYHDKQWSHVIEYGTQARVGMFSNGIKAFVSSSMYGGVGTWMHIVGRMSAYVNFPVLKILAALNEAEGLTDSPSKWGGGETIGGSPRSGGSKLNPEAVRDVVCSVLTR